MTTGVYTRSEKEKKRLKEMIKTIAPVVPKGFHICPKTEFKTGNIPWNKGGKHPKVTGDLSPSKRPEVRAKISKARKGNMTVNYARGERHHAWKGGKTPLIMKIRNHPQYVEWRNGVYKRDNYTCFICGDNRGRNLNAHHVRLMSGIIHRSNIKTIEEALNLNELWDLKNGLTLCEKCHVTGNEISRIVEILAN